VIDPVLIYATYVGGSGGDIGYGIAVDAFFDAISRGSPTLRISLRREPVPVFQQGRWRRLRNRNKHQGTQLIYSTYLGGSGSDTATAIALANGSAYVTGYRLRRISPPWLRQERHKPSFQQIYGGNTDAFVTALNTTVQR